MEKIGKMKPKIGFIITTFQRDELLFKSVQSLVDNWQDNFRLIIIDQGELSVEKHKWIINGGIPNYYNVPFNSGLSYCRNYGVKKAKELGCDYVVIASDSFLFNSTIKWLPQITNQMYPNFDRIGFELENCCCGWEAKLNLLESESFELDFIDKEGSDFYSILHPLQYRIYRCDIVRNFFVATTDSLLDAPWDENLKLCEHEDHAWVYKQKGYKTGWTNKIYAEKMTDRPKEYRKYRQENFREGMKYLREKWDIKGWVTYKHLERAKNG
jgi:glycosyltransferase involved in cell wall biosynthesis